MISRARATSAPADTLPEFGLLYAVPAGIGGYHAVLGLSHIGVPSLLWRGVFAGIGALLIGATAWARMSLFVPLVLGPGVGDGRAQSMSLAGASRDG
jgi:hypothetical protein